MSFKLKAEDLSPALIQGCQRVSKAKLGFKYAWHMKTLCQRIDKALQFLEEQNNKIIMNYREEMKKHVQLDDEGNFVLDTYKEEVKDPSGEVIFKVGDKKANSYVPKSDEDEKQIKILAENTKSEMDELREAEVDIDYSKLPIEALENIEISADDLDALEPILDISEAVKNNVIKK